MHRLMFWPRRHCIKNVWPIALFFLMMHTLIRHTKCIFIHKHMLNILTRIQQFQFRFQKSSSLLFIIHSLGGLLNYFFVEIFEFDYIDARDSSLHFFTIIFHFGGAKNFFVTYFALSGNIRFLGFIFQRELLHPAIPWRQTRRFYFINLRFIFMKVKTSNSLFFNIQNFKWFESISRTNTIAAIRFFINALQLA